MKYDTRTDAWRSLVWFFFAAHIPANDTREGATQVFCGLGRKLRKNVFFC